MRVDEELERVVPLVEALARDGIRVSVDTQKPEVMRAALAAGAGMVNDVRALREPGALDAAVAGHAAVCLMHMQGEPRTMQAEPRYDDVVAEVRDFLRRARAPLRSGGHRPRAHRHRPGLRLRQDAWRIISRLLRSLRVLADTGYPVLAGLSRKSMLGGIAGRDVNERASASVAAALAAVARGAAIVRVHDVRETVDALKVWHAIETEIEPD